MSNRYAVRGLSPRRFRLTMARTDIANCLRFAAETVSRILKRFRQAGLGLRARRATAALPRGSGTVARPSRGASGT